MTTVDLTLVKKDLKKLPKFILKKLQIWATQVELLGIKEVSKVPGYHDEPLKGKRGGQRSIRLNRAYRAIYIENKSTKELEITIIEVNKHEY